MWIEAPDHRLFIFAAVLAACLVFETLRPRRQLTTDRRHRWTLNFAMGVINVIILRLAVPAGLLGIAAMRPETLLSDPRLGYWGSIALTLLLFDLAIYAQHRLFHRIDVLWAFHRIHHTDRDLDTSSALRFHMGEYVFSFAYKAALVWVLAPRPEAILLFEILLSSFALFNHSNGSLGAFDQIFAKLIVTPDMHRLHHSTQPGEANQNFGFCLSLWDRVFRSYRSHPERPMDTLPLGVEDDHETDSLMGRIIEPLRRL